MKFQKIVKMISGDAKQQEIKEVVAASCKFLCKHL